MSPDEIKHFLVMRDHATGVVKVKRFGTDYDAAQAAYAEAERAHVEDGLDIVLLSADSLATIKETRSSYFEAGGSRLAQLLKRLRTGTVLDQLQSVGAVTAPADAFGIFDGLYEPGHLDKLRAAERA